MQKEHEEGDRGRFRNEPAGHRGEPKQNPRDEKEPKRTERRAGETNDGEHAEKERASRELRLCDEAQQRGRRDNGGGRDEVRIEEPRLIKNRHRRAGEQGRARRGRDARQTQPLEDVGEGDGRPQAESDEHQIEGDPGLSTETLEGETNGEVEERCLVVEREHAPREIVLEIERIEDLEKIVGRARVERDTECNAVRKPRDDERERRERARLHRTHTSER